MVYLFKSTDFECNECSIKLHIWHIYLFLDFSFLFFFSLIFFISARRTNRWAMLQDFMKDGETLWTINQTQEPQTGFLWVPRSQPLQSV